MLGENANADPSISSRFVGNPMSIARSKSSPMQGCGFPMQGLKSQTKTFRLGPELVEMLDRAAKRAHITESAFVAAVLEDRLIIDPIIPALPQIRLSAETFQSILNAANVDALEMAGSEIAQRNFPLIRELYEASGRIMDFTGFITEVLGSYGHWFYVEGDATASRARLMLRHSYGMNWSIFVKSYLLSAHSTVSKEKIRIEVAAQFIRVDFSAP